MKKLSDYKDDEALELWGDLLEPITNILGDPEIAETITSKAPKLMQAKKMIELHSEDVKRILLRIDPAPLTALNIITRVMSLLAEIGEDEDLKPFFGYAEQETIKTS